MPTVYLNLPRGQSIAHPTNLIFTNENFMIKYKKILLLLLTSVPLQSFGLSESNEKFCTGLSGFANHIMSLRQHGVPPKKQISAYQSSAKNHNVSKIQNDVNLSIITDAYNGSIHNDDLEKQNVAKEFEEKYYLECINSFLK